MTDLEVCSFLALYFDDGSFNITDWLLPLAREISACNFFIGRSYCTAFPGFYGKQASEIKAKPGTIWSMMSSTDSGLKMSIGLNKVIRSERFQSYTGPRSLMGKFNRCTCKCLPLQRGEVGISFQAPAIHGHQVRYSTEKGIRLALQLTVEAMLLSCYPCNCCRSITFSGLVSLSWTARPDGPFPSHRARWAFPILGHPLPQLDWSNLRLPLGHLSLFLNCCSFLVIDTSVSKWSLILQALSASLWWRPDPWCGHCSILLF